MKKMLAFIVFAFLLFGVFHNIENTGTKSLEVLSLDINPSYWLLLHRKSNVEFLYLGTPGQKDRSTLVKTFTVKTGIPGQSPTPLPKLLGRDYWIITKKEESKDNPETAPYFLTLDIPVSENYPFGPDPYIECNGQCSWKIPGYFGLHGVNEDKSKLLKENPGSLGCIRHSDEDISYLYNLLDINDNIRYYIGDA